MKVVLLCGGFGTRIRDVAEDIPKPMIPVGGFPILWHIMKTYAHFGHKDFVLCLGYKGHAVKDFFINYEARTNDLTMTLGQPRSIVYHTSHREADWQVTLADTGVQAMTGARVRRVRRYLETDETFLLSYGDGVSDVNLDELLAFHRSHGRIMTVTGVRPPGRFGEIIHDADGRIVTFNEKPQVGSGLISGGFFVCQRELFRYLDDREDLVFEQEPMRALVQDGQFMVYEHKGFWHPMDTARDHKYLNHLCEEGEAPWMNWK